MSGPQHLAATSAFLLPPAVSLACGSDAYVNPSSAHKPLQSMHRAGARLRTGGWVYLPAVRLGFVSGEASEHRCVPVPRLLETLQSVFCVRREQMGAFPPSAPGAEKGMCLENCSMSAKNHLNCVCGCLRNSLDRLYRRSGRRRDGVLPRGLLWRFGCRV